MKNKITLSLGSNFGDRTAFVTAALHWLQQVISVSKSSSIYETPELHGKGAPYMNAVVTGETDKTFIQLNNEIKNYEYSCGRNAETRNLGIVPIDIDIVIWNDDILRPADFSHSFFRIGYRECSDSFLKIL